MRLFENDLNYIKKIVYNYVEAKKLIYENPTLILHRGARVVNSKLGKSNLLSPNSLLMNSSLGDYSYLADGALLRDATVGKFTSIGPNVLIGLGEHPSSKFVSSHPAFYSLRKQVGVTFVDEQAFSEFPSKVVIGNDVWIGANCILGSKVSVGDGAIIAAGSVVTKPVPPYAVVGGVPASILKYRFSENQIKKLLDLKWWDNSEEYFREKSTLMQDVNKFLGEA